MGAGRQEQEEEESGRRQTLVAGKQGAGAGGVRRAAGTAVGTTHRDGIIEVVDKRIQGRHWRRMRMRTPEAERHALQEHLLALAPPCLLYQVAARVA